jgi:hypothetical protein
VKDNVKLVKNTVLTVLPVKKTELTHQPVHVNLTISITPSNVKNVVSNVLNVSTMLILIMKLQVPTVYLVLLIESTYHSVTVQKDIMMMSFVVMIMVIVNNVTIIVLCVPIT